jgi:hypothetical protein
MRAENSKYPHLRQFESFELLLKFSKSSFLRIPDQGPGQAQESSLETFENLLFTVTPAKAGVQNVLKSLDSGFHRNDDLSSFGRNSKVSSFQDLLDSRLRGNDKVGVFFKALSLNLTCLIFSEFSYRRVCAKKGVRM